MDAPPLQEENVVDRAKVEHYQRTGCIPCFRMVERSAMENDFLHWHYQRFRTRVANGAVSMSLAPDDEGSSSNISVAACSPPWSELRFKAHLFLPWLFDLLVGSEVLKRYAETMLLTEDERELQHSSVVEHGEEQKAGKSKIKHSTPVVIWSTDFCVKPAESKAFFSWHQDSTYSRFRGDQGVTVWLAFSDVTERAGPVLFREGSHRLGQLPHDENVGQEGNMLAFGQTIERDKLEAIRTDERSFPTVAAILAPGEASAHNFFVVHSSQANQEHVDRVGLAIRLVRADAAILEDAQQEDLRCDAPRMRRDRVTLLTGRPEDVHGFELENHFWEEGERVWRAWRPTEEFGRKEMAEWKKSMDREKEMYFEGRGEGQQKYK
ncbi:unnamed protein product [Amoebophrya sp. A120]|nr:unnamed protein product [Amoebophrya sp. A120]|eukprot:GSA120T00006638001.1